MHEIKLLEDIIRLKERPYPENNFANICIIFQHMFISGVFLCWSNILPLVKYSKCS